jgi:hypothetical protein
MTDKTKEDQAQDAGRNDGNGLLAEGAPGKQPSEERLTPEFLEWARQQFPREEILRGLEEVRKKGGVPLSAFVHELEQLVQGQ